MLLVFSSRSRKFVKMFDTNPGQQQELTRFLFYSILYLFTVINLGFNYSYYDFVDYRVF